MKTFVYCCVSFLAVCLALSSPVLAQDVAAMATASDLSDDDEGLMLHGRFNMAFVTLGQTWQQEAVVGQTEYPLAGSFDQSPGTGPLGIELGTQIWWEDIMAVDMRMMWASYKMSIGDSKFSDGIMDLAIGVRYPFWTNDSITLDGGAWFSSMDMAGFAAVDGAAELRNYTVTGGRFGLGASWVGESLAARVELSETFAPAPVKFALKTGIDYRLEDSPLGDEDNAIPLVVNAYYSLSSRSMEVVADKLTVTDKHHIIGLGVTVELDYLDEYLWGG